MLKSLYLFGTRHFLFGYIMAKELPYFRFTVSEWLNDDISLESYHLQGVFASVCAFYWFKDCSITQAMLKKRFSNAKADVEELLELGILKEIENDFVSIKFLDEQFDLLSEKRQKRVKAGRKGGLSRASKAQAMLKQSSSYKDKDKDKDNYNDKELVDSKEPMESESFLIAERVSNYLYQSILNWDGTHKYHNSKPSLSSWVKDIERAIRLDLRTEEQLNYIIEAVFIYSKKLNVWDGWASNIQSGKKLRDQFDTIKNQIKTNADNKPKNNGDKFFDMLRTNYD